MQICTICKEYKDYTEFGKHSKSRNGLKHQCKNCRSVQSKLHYDPEKEKDRRLSNIEQERAQDREYSRAKKEKNKNKDYSDTYGIYVCSMCNIEFPLNRDYFGVDRTTVRGFDNRCKKCKAGYIKELRVKSPEKFKKTLMKSYHKNIEKHRERGVVYYNKTKNTANKIYNTYKNDAKTKGKEFTLTREFVADLVACSCYYCGRKYDKMGIDRVDNTLGYSSTNVVSCCSMCNFAKLSNTHNEFITMCSLVTEKHQESIGHCTSNMLYFNL